MSSEALAVVRFRSIPGRKRFVRRAPGATAVFGLLLLLVHLEALLGRRADIAMDAATREVLEAFLRSQSSWVVENLLRRALLAFAQERGLCKVYWSRGWFERVRKSPELRRDFLASLSAALTSSGARRGECEHNEAP